MTTEKLKTRTEKLTDISDKQNALIAMITDVSDSYSEYQEASLLISNLKNASDQLQKITLIIASNETPKVNENQVTPKN